jgi:Transglycosylase-like domain
MKRAGLTASLLLAVTACGSSGARWPATTHLDNASVPVDYCSAAYQARFGWADPEKAARVCRCESKGNPHAVSPNGLYAGLFQFSRATWRSVGAGDPFDPATNSEHAYRLFSRRGWRPWPVCGR